MYHEHERERKKGMYDDDVLRAHGDAVMFSRLLRDKGLGGIDPMGY
jgi:hypothetical protein